MSILIPSGVNVGFNKGIFIRRSSTKKDPLAGLLLLRLEGDQITGLLNNASVSPWPNIGTSGATNNAVQSNTMMQPTWLASDAKFNGKPSVVFDAVDDNLSPALSLTNPYTIVIVARALDLSIESANRTVQSGSINALMSINRTADAIYVEGDVAGSTAADGTAAHILSLAVGAASHAYLDGADVTTGAAQLLDWGLFILGGGAGSGASAEVANAAIAAIGVFAGVNDTKRQLIESTWKAKYGTP